jgi:sigma-B regulation protein RsbQ
LISAKNGEITASTSIGEFIASEITHSQLKVIAADGHCLHMTHPDAIIKSIIEYAN